MKYSAKNAILALVSFCIIVVGIGIAGYGHTKWCETQFVWHDVPEDWAGDRMNDPVDGMTNVAFLDYTYCPKPSTFRIDDIVYIEMAGVGKVIEILEDGWYRVETVEHGEMNTMHRFIEARD